MLKNIPKTFENQKGKSFQFILIVNIIAAID